MKSLVMKISPFTSSPIFRCKSVVKLANLIMKRKVTADLM